MVSVLMENTSKLYKYLFFGCLAALLIFSVIPDFEVESQAEDLNFNFNFGLRADYFAHLVAYIALVVFFLLWKNKRKVLYPILALGIGISVAVLTEFQQLFIPGRTCNPVDMFYSGLGVLVGVVGLLVVRAFVKRGT